MKKKIGYVYPEGGSLTLEISGHPYADTIEYTCLSTPHINSAGQLYFQFFDQFPNNTISVYLTLFPPLVEGSYPIILSGSPKNSSAYFGVSIKTDDSSAFDEIFDPGGKTELGQVIIEKIEDSKIKGRIENAYIRVLGTDKYIEISGEFLVNNI